jgi:hypothetical protein
MSLLIVTSAVESSIHLSLTSSHFNFLEVYEPLSLLHYSFSSKFPLIALVVPRVMQC